LAFRHEVLSAQVCELAYPALLKAAVVTDNRGTAAGGGWHHRVKKDGTISSRRRAWPVRSGVMGFLDPQGPDRHCRATAYTAHELEGWCSVQPLIQGVNEVYKHECPARYAAQLAAVKATHPYWVIRGTVFTTLTVNRNVRFAVHKDKGDLP